MGVISSICAAISSAYMRLNQERHLKLGKHIRFRLQRNLLGKNGRQ